MTGYYNSKKSISFAKTIQMNYFKLLVFTIIIFLFSCNNQTTETSPEKNIDKNTSTETIESITKSIRETPTDASLFKERAKLYSDKLDMDNAINDMKIAISLDSSKGDYFNIYSQYLLQTGKSGKSKEILERCIKIHPKNTEALINLAQIHLYVKQYRESIDLLQKAQEIDDSIDKIYFIRGVIFQETNDTIRAIKSYIFATEKNPNNYNAYIQLGLLFFNSTDSISIQYLNNAIRINPNKIEAYYNLGMYYQNAKKYNQAIATYNNIIEKIDNSFPQAYFNLGFIYMEVYKDYKKAIECFINASNLQPKYLDAIFNTALCYEKSNNNTNAIKLYNEILIINPKYDNAIIALNRIMGR